VIAPPAGWVERVVAFDGLEVTIHLPPDPFAEDLIDMEVYEREGELPYWAELWPSGVALARALSGRRLGGARVLELGCGMALPGIVAALQGAHVTATDFQPDALTAAEHNARVNGVDMTFELLDWREHDAVVARAPWDLVIAADVLYEGHMVDSLLGILVALRSPVLLADQGRIPGQPFFGAAAEHFTIAAHTDPELTHVSVYDLRPSYV